MNLNRVQLFDFWAPPNALWSQWAKPVLFAHVQPSSPSFAPLWRDVDLAWAPAFRDSTALILDLPGSFAVAMGLALAARGYRPVPLFNSAPGPSPVIDNAPIISALSGGAEDLSRCVIPDDAPPAFMLDAGRLVERSAAKPGMFDNRWIVFPQDFPSANFLLSRHIRRVTLVQHGNRAADDLSHVLFRWREAGIDIWNCDLNRGGMSEPLAVRRPGNFKAIWQRSLVLLGFRRHGGGGFGSVVPMPHSGGSG
jgi:hypothetical protein